jgi:hypothetical protein
MFIGGSGDELWFDEARLLASAGRTSVPQVTIISVSYCHER